MLFETIRTWINAPVISLFQELNAQLKEIKKMVDGIPELDAAITAEGTNVQTIVNALPEFATVATNVSNDIKTLLGKISGGTAPADLTNEVTGIQAQAAALSNAATQLKSISDDLTAADATVNPPAAS